MKRGFSTDEAAQYIGMPVAWLIKKRRDPLFGARGPEFIRIDGRIIYRKEDLDAWLDSLKPFNPDPIETD